jgi:diguanylate cyclase (GGDEF)-like protein
MEHILLFVLLGVAVLSILPVLSLNSAHEDKKYKCLKYLINVAFVWTLLIFIQLLSNSMVVVYYAYILGFPLKFLLASLMVCTLLNYIEKKVYKGLIYAFYGLLSIEFVIALTNNFTGFFIEGTIGDFNSLEMLTQWNHGPLFIYHLIISYSILIVGIGYLFICLRKNRSIRQYKSITYTMVVSIVVVLSFNALQLLFIETVYDLTYMSLVIVAYLLYRVIYTKDMVFNLKTSGHGEILSNMREMYILTDIDKNIVEISGLLLDKYRVDEERFVGRKLEELIVSLGDQIVFYSEYDVDRDVEGDEEKDHFHLREKKFKLKGMNDFGYMILLYDETQVFGLLRELNKLSNYDSMTGLHNRNYIENKLVHLNHHKDIGILSLDLNGLKVNNDYLGHERGDYLLKELSSKMKQVMVEYDKKHLARIGGDEFLIILEDTTEQTLLQVKDELLELCNHEEINKVISVSIGTAFNKGEEDIFKLLQDADENMYEMKRKQSKEYSKLIVEYAKKADQFIR